MAEQIIDTVRAERLLRLMLNDFGTCWLNEELPGGDRHVLLETSWMSISAEDAAYLESLRQSESGDGD